MSWSGVWSAIVRFVSGDFFAALPSFLLAGAALWGAYVAWRGLGVWGEQQQRNLEHQILKEFYVSFLKLKPLLGSLDTKKIFEVLESALELRESREATLDKLEQIDSELKSFLENMKIKSEDLFNMRLEAMREFELTRVVLYKFTDYLKMKEDFFGAYDIISEQMDFIIDVIADLAKIYVAELEEFVREKDARSRKELEASLKKTLKVRKKEIEESGGEAKDKIGDVDVRLIIFLRQRIHFNRPRKGW